MLVLLKYIGIVLAAAFGILGMLTDFKDRDTKKVTVWGKIAVSGAILSALVAVFSQRMEDQQAQKAARDAANQAAVLSAQQLALSTQQTHVSQEVDTIARTAEPIRETSVEFWIEFPRPDPNGDENLVKTMAPYLSRLDKSVAQIVNQYPKPYGGPQDYGLVALPNADKPLKVTIPSGSRLLPSPSEGVPFQLLSKLFFYVDVFNAPIPPGKFWSELDWHNEALFNTAGKVLLAKSPDLEFGDSFQFYSSASQGELVYDIASRQINVHCKKLIPPEKWTSNGTIKYVQDLLGKQVYLRWQLGQFDSADENTSMQDMLKNLPTRPFALMLSSDVKLDTAEISINGSPYEFRGSDFLSEGSHVIDCVYLTLPSNRAGLNQLISEGWNENGQ